MAPTLVNQASGSAPTGWVIGVCGVDVRRTFGEGMPVMGRTSLTVCTAAVAAVLALAACGNSSNQSKSTSGTSAVTTSESGTAAHNQADVAFAEQMAPHHQTGVQMCDTVLGKPGIDARVVDLTNQMKGEQASQIQQLQTWLNQWGRPAMPSPSPTAMPGMMSPNDMATLQSAQGPNAGKVFLTQMITHHRGGIAMAQKEVQSGQFPSATAMAQNIVNTQQQEINKMQGLLSSL